MRCALLLFAFLVVVRRACKQLFHIDLSVAAYVEVSVVSLSAAARVSSRLPHNVTVATHEPLRVVESRAAALLRVASLRDVSGAAEMRVSVVGRGTTTLGVGRLRHDAASTTHVDC